jgi:hypothetical protein
MNEQRRYVLTKIEPGDYLLPGNDGRSLWRIKRGTELEPVRSGGGCLVHEWTRTVHVWEAWRYLGRISAGRDLPDDFLEWSEWELMASWCATRAKAIREAVRLSSP